MTSDTDGLSFDGEQVTSFIAQLPSVRLEAPEAYPRGTVLTLTVHVKVKNAFTDEDRKGNLFVRHNLLVEDCSIIDVLTPAQRQAIIEAAECESVEPENCAVHGELGLTRDPIPGQTTIDEMIAESTADTIERYGAVLDRLGQS